MPHSDDLKYYWFTPMRTAGRTCNRLLIYFKFENLGHQLKIHEDRKDYSIILNTRHPYTRLVSLYNLYCMWEQVKNDNFGEWLTNYLTTWYPKYEFQIFYKELLNKRNESKLQVVKIENLYGDLEKIPFVQNKMDILKPVFDEFILMNEYYNEFEYSDLIVKRDWKEFYNQDLIDLVKKTLYYQFDFFQYNPDYWKDDKPQI